MIRRAHLTWQIIRFQIQEFITDRFDEPDFLERGRGSMWCHHGVEVCWHVFPAQNSLGSLIWAKVFGLYITQ